jgi:hypothetical protein
MIYMGIMLEKWPNKGQEYLKYMCNVRFAADRGSGTGWVLCDEQYRLRKVRYLFSSWGELDMAGTWAFWRKSPSGLSGITSRALESAAASPAKALA